MLIFGAGGAPATPVLGLPPAVAPAGVAEEVTGSELVVGLGFFSHIEKFNATSKDRIANRIIIKRGKAFKCSRTKNKCFLYAIAGKLGAGRRNQNARF